MDERVAALERECAELRRQLAATRAPAVGDAAAFLDSLLGAVPDFIIRTDGDMRVIYINHVRAETRREAVLGREIWDFLDPSSVAAARACIDGVLATGVPNRYEAIAVGADGMPAHFET